MDDRYLAHKILLKIELDKAYSNLTLDSVLKTNEATNKAFVSALVYGVLERKITLDYFLSKVLTQPIKKLSPQVLTILRIGVYQIKYMDKVPDSAAVNECVKLSRKVKCSYASGLINSVLRKISQKEIPLPETDNKIYNLSVAYSCPESLVKHFCDDYGYITAENILKASLVQSTTVLRVNTLKTDADELISLLKNEDVIAEKGKTECSLKIVGGKSPFATEAYKNGLFFVQDYASQICTESLGAESGDTVFDMCAAPGGKSFTLAILMKNKGKVYSFDLYEHKIGLIHSGAERLGIDIINAQTGDAAKFNPTLPKADKILCDVPCGGLGDIGRKPEIKYKDFGFIDKLCDLQYNILSNASRYLKDNGTLIYSTCSLSKKENEDICEKFVADNKEFKNCGMFTVFPTEDGSDGFFYAKFVKE